jgi:TonB family protein
MKFSTPLSVFLITLFLLIPELSFAQNDTTFFDSDWTANNGLNKSYYRTSRKVDTVYSADSLIYIEDHFMNNKVQMTGFLSATNSEDNHLRHGQFVYYDSFGHKTNEGLYRMGNHTGSWLFYYVGSDKIKAEKQFLDDKLNGHAVYYDSISGEKFSEGDFSDNKCVGSWKVYERGTVKYESLFEEGKIQEYTAYGGYGKALMKCTFNRACHKKCTCFGANGEISGCPDEDFWINTGQETAFPLYDLDHFFKVSMVYPKTASDLDIHGDVVIRFMVNEDGTISDVSLVKGIGGGCDQEALRVIKNMAPWNPVIRNNKPEKSYYSKTFIFGHKQIRWLVEFR